MHVHVTSICENMVHAQFIDVQGKSSLGNLDCKKATLSVEKNLHNTFLNEIFIISQVDKEKLELFPPPPFSKIFRDFGSTMSPYLCVHLFLHCNSSIF